MFSTSCPKPCANTLVRCCTSVIAYIYFVENLWDNVKAKYPLPALLTSSTVCLICGDGRHHPIVKIHNALHGNFGASL